MYSVYSSLAYAQPDRIATLYNDKNDKSVDAALVQKCTELPLFVNNEETHTQGYIFKTGTEIIIACRGTDNLYDCFDDLDVCLVPLVLDGYPTTKVHAGFLRQSKGLLENIKAVVDHVQSNKIKLVFCGHSLGAAIATICAVTVSAESIKDVFVYGYGSPKVGDKEFKKVFDTLITNVTLVKFGCDPFTKLMIGDDYEQVTDLIHYGPIDHHPGVILLTDAPDHNIKNYVLAEKDLVPTQSNWWQDILIHVKSAISTWLNGL